MTVIETNIAIGKDGKIVDHQSRIAKFNDIKTWDEYVNLYKNYDGKNGFGTEDGTMPGPSIPPFCKIEDLVFDDFHLRCELTRAFGLKDIKMAYLPIQSEM